MENLKVIVETKSNFKNANGKELEVVEIKNRRVTCKVPFYGFTTDPLNGNYERWCDADFTLDEVLEFI